MIVLNQRVPQLGQSSVPNLHSLTDPLITSVLNLGAGYYCEFYARVALLILFLGLAVFSVFTYRRAAQKTFQGYAWEDRKNLATVCLLFVWSLSVIVLPLFLTPFVAHDLISPRYMIAASAPLYLLVGKGIRNINYNYAKLAVIAIVVILSIANLQTFYATTRNPTIANAVNFVNKNAKNGDLVILYPYSEAYVYYGLRQDLGAKIFPARLSYLTTKTADENIKELTAKMEGYRGNGLSLT